MRRRRNCARLPGLRNATARFVIELVVFGLHAIGLHVEHGIALDAGHGIRSNIERFRMSGRFANRKAQNLSAASVIAPYVLPKDQSNPAR